MEKSVVKFKGFKNRTSLWVSNLGFYDLYSGASLAYMMIDKWYLYSRNLVLRKFHDIFLPGNDEELKHKEMKELFKNYSFRIDEGVFSEVDILDLDKIEESWRRPPWWQVQAVKTLTISEPRFYSAWYRLFLPDPETSIFNEEWEPPDEFFQIEPPFLDINSSSRKVPIYWNELDLMERDYLYHSLNLLIFNKAFSFLDNNREMLDFIADYLIRNDIIRLPEIEKFMKNFSIKENEPINNEKDKEDIITETDDLISEVESATIRNDDSISEKDTSKSETENISIDVMDDPLFKKDTSNYENDTVIDSNTDTKDFTKEKDASKIQTDNSLLETQNSTSEIVDFTMDTECSISEADSVNNETADLLSETKEYNKPTYFKKIFDPEKEFIFDKSWGSRSRKKISKFILLKSSKTNE